MFVRSLPLLVSSPCAGCRIRSVLCSVQSRVCFSGVWKYKTPGPNPCLISVNSQNWYVFPQITPGAAPRQSALLRFPGAGGKKKVTFQSKWKICARTSHVLSLPPSCQEVTDATNSPKTTTCTGPSPPSPSIFLCVYPFLSVPAPSSSSHPLLHHAGSLVFLKTSTGAWKGTRLRGAGRWAGGGGVT